MSKKCTKCSLDKELSGFPPNKGTTDGKGSWCRACMRAQSRTYLSNPSVKEAVRSRSQIHYAKNRTEILAYHAERNSKLEVKMKLNENHLRRKYGMSASDYLSMLEKQFGKCAICLKPPATNRKLHVDHNHKTGKVRSLLCRACNNAIGALKEDPEIMERATQYIEAHNG